jgi:hypothetical protein
MTYYRKTRWRDGISSSIGNTQFQKRQPVFGGWFACHDAGVGITGRLPVEITTVYFYSKNTFCCMYFALDRYTDYVIWRQFLLLVLPNCVQYVLHTRVGQCNGSIIQELTSKENDAHQKLYLPIRISCKETTFAACHAHGWLCSMTCQSRGDSLFSTYTKPFVYLVENCEEPCD